MPFPSAPAKLLAMRQSRQLREGLHNVPYAKLTADLT